MASTDVPAATWLVELMLNDSAARREAAAERLFGLPTQETVRILRLNNIVIRGLSRLTEVAPPTVRPWLEQAREKALDDGRVRLKVLAGLTAAFDTAGVRYVIQKTLDNWPDFGTDIDVLIAGPPDPGVWRRACESAFPEGRWLPFRKLCDVLARKWTYEIPALCNPEIHFGCIGQVGEHRDYPALVGERRLDWDHEGVRAWVPSIEDRLLLAVLQRVYRHFWVRVCDVVNWADWVTRPGLDWDYVWATAARMGIRPGVEYYVWCLRGVAEGTEVGQRVSVALDPLRIPDRRHGRLTLRRNLYRMPLFPDPARLYAAQVGHDLADGRLGRAARVSLVFPLGVLTWVSNVLFHDDPIW